MINAEQKKDLKLMVDNIYSDINFNKIEHIIRWKWFNLLTYLGLILLLTGAIIWTIFAFNPNFSNLNQKLFLILTIIFLILLFLTMVLIFWVHKKQQQIIKKIKEKFNYQKLLPLYQTILNSNNKIIKIKTIDYQWTINPNNNYYHLNETFNDLIIDGNYDTFAFNLGTVSLTTSAVLDNLQPNLQLQPQNLNYYRCLFLTIDLGQKASHDFEITHKNHYQKNDLTFANFFNYDQDNKILTPAFQEAILVLMQTTKLIPNIKLVNNVLSLHLATINSNNGKDNYDSLFNFPISLNPVTTYHNILNTLAHDYQILIKSLAWLEIAKKVSYKLK
ncbi:hypothetical protein SSYRP_v1c04270 [Spiroplasma syrphidicola EA-1]|uniref:DUF3137 domain-containing protein n=1 Tax=Spiroplasma syrphidicola EA-1 TaxID=1276229 RepID=R4UIM3_9MOLU|nr:hypothetical protein [Spiroplasma syrphidicola]AGM26020.1 hypothetical protein SSYRP_v1c04270 [Spiroplasma syrphidicola EA-1]